GRLGHCTIFGSGLWAEKRGSTCIGVTVSGCGEAIVRADFCRSLSKRLFSRFRDPDELPAEVIRAFFEHEFLDLGLMSTIAANRLYVGGLVLLREEDKRYELIVFHNTPVLPFAYRK
ncbi:hypothetical protein Angca_001797, partial [Angiostrongylus cantonensis]